MGSRFSVGFDTTATEAWHQLSLGARLLRCLLPIAAHDDDPAGFCADPNYLGAALFPYKWEPDEARIAEWLDELERAELIHVRGSGEDAEGVMLRPARVA